MQSMLMRIFLVLTILTLINPSPSSAANERRMALVIGNGSYAASPLRNPVNDATDMASSLKMMGFNVILKTNASKKDMGKAVEDFEKQLKGRDVGLFYYAGHGVQVNGVNYLIPIGSKVNEETDMEYEAIDAGRILAAMHNAKSRVNIVILDACRDNPYVRSFRSSTRGLAVIARAPTGTIISYSTSPGDVALDGKGRNSPYTSLLMQYMKQPGLTIEQVFKNVRQKIDSDTDGKQVPWELSSLKGDFFFIHGKSNALAATAEILPSPKEKPADELDLAMAKVQEKKDEEDRIKSEKEGMYRALASDIKKYRSIKEADIDETLKVRAWQSLIKKYPQWTANVGIGKEMGIIDQVLHEDKSGLFKKILEENDISIIREIAKDGRFIAYDNWTVLDTKTNLMWAAVDNGTDINWANAKSYCDSYRGGGYTDWRMPTQDELAELFDSSKSYNAPRRDYEVHLTKLIQISVCCPWASEIRGHEAAVFSFGLNGDRYWMSRSTETDYRVLPVRSAK
ncbi:MAG: caspase family protein [Smithellaceae bacterium]